MDQFWNNTHAKFTKFRSDLFHVQNGVIDLRSRVFRPAKYDEYVHYTTENEFKPADPAVKKRVLDELWKIYASDDQVMTKLISIADCLVAGNQFRSFGIETGSGSNGRGVAGAVATGWSAAKPLEERSSDAINNLLGSLPSTSTILE
eukprot:SAG22_NODE_257_length_13543_cov_26.100417_10_plen_147_part_00